MKRRTRKSQIQSNRTRRDCPGKFSLGVKYAKMWLMEKAREVLVVFLVLSVSLIFSGCQKKPPQSTTSLSADNGLSEAIDQDDTGETISDLQGGVQIESPQDSGGQAKLEVEALASQYEENLNSATQIANSTLQNTASFCSAIIEFPGSDTIANAKQTFFFTSSQEYLKDWYWVVEFDELEGKLKGGKKRELFAARRGFDEVKCVKPEQARPKVSYAAAYAKAQEVGAISAELDAAKVKIILAESAWLIEIWGRDGTITASVPVDSSQAIVNLNQEETTPTPTDALQSNSSQSNSLQPQSL